MFAGWILGKKAQVVSIEVINDGRVIQTIAINYPRPDVAQTYTEVANAETSGFWEKVALNELPVEVELLIQAVFSDESRLPISKVKLQKQLTLIEKVKTDLARSQTRLQAIQSELNSSQSNAVKFQASITYTKTQ